jgi:hypothetical protein
MFTINDSDYMSAPSDPVHGTFNVNLGHRFAPSLTMGFGNMLRRDSHWSVPVDFGVEYIGQPRFTLNMQGSVCDSDDDCTPVQQDAGTMANLAQQQKDIDSDIAPLRFFPILKVGLSYRFGRIHEMSNGASKRHNTDLHRFHRSESSQIKSSQIRGSIRLYP